MRPVTFKLKTDEARTLQYGLVAEEVAKIYPELVIRGIDGRINGVRYEEPAPMILNEAAAAATGNRGAEAIERKAACSSCKTALSGSQNANGRCARGHTLNRDAAA